MSECCGGIHPAVPKRAYLVRLSWYRPWNVAPRVRVESWTCTCTQPVYELCFGGGLGFIRRTTVRVIDGRGRREVRETDRWITDTARTKWNALLAGLAR